MSKYTDNVKNGLKGLTAFSTGICPGCVQCQDQYDMSEGDLDVAVSEGRIFDEGEFSWYPCEVCGTTEAGQRYVAHALSSEVEDSEDAAVIHMIICEDCLRYIANGEEPE